MNREKADSRLSKLDLIVLTSDASSSGLQQTATHPVMETHKQTRAAKALNAANRSNNVDMVSRSLHGVSEMKIRQWSDPVEPPLIRRGSRLK